MENRRTLTKYEIHIYVESREIYWKSIEELKWTKMFQFVPCITSLNYLWGKFHTDVNTISIVIRKIWFYPGLTHFIILQERRKQSLGSYWWYFSTVIFLLSGSGDGSNLVSVPSHLYLAPLQTNGDKTSHEALYTNRKCENETFLQTEVFMTPREI